MLTSAAAAATWADIHLLAGGQLLLASASQDKHIRIWALREASMAKARSSSAVPVFARSATCALAALELDVPM